MIISTCVGIQIFMSEGTDYFKLNSYYIPYVYFRNKFNVKVSTYMMELYNDRLIDLFAKPGTSDDVSLKFCYAYTSLRKIIKLFKIDYPLITTLSFSLKYFEIDNILQEKKFNRTI